MPFLILVQAAPSPAPAYFQNPRLQESSGVVISRTYPGILWTHNDANNPPFLFVTDLRGRDRGRMLVPGVRGGDWEDLELGPCPRPTVPPAPSCLYIADTGDNDGSRSSVRIYAIPEPRPSTRPSDTLRTTAPPIVLRLKYDDGPRDVEAMYIDPGDTTVYLVSKGNGKARDGGNVIRLYRVGRHEWTKRTGVATPVQTLDIQPSPQQGRVVTGAAMTRDGALVALRTYGEIYQFRRGPGGQLTPLGEPRNVGSLGGGGESIGFLNDSTLVLTHEASRGLPGRLYLLPFTPAARQSAR
ncbi:MAG TPA: hypothetical protein VFM23_09655 [Gemmatimonadales bacterium]|nr:hypothetical protein [Gemmatimonadales bacterium]